MTESIVQFQNSNGESIEWKIYHNLEDFGLEIEAAAINWVFRTTKFTPKSLCNYIMSKDPINIVAMTEAEYKQITPKNKNNQKLERKDADGNRLFKEIFKNGNYLLTLKLLKEKKTRRIGVVDVEEGVIYVTRSREKHVLHSNNSYGFNDIAVQQPGVKEVVITDEEGTFRVPVKVLVEEGKYLFFKQTGFERQLFLPLKTIEKYEV